MAIDLRLLQQYCCNIYFVKGDKALFFLILGIQIFFQNIKVGGGKKIKIKITIFFFSNLKHIWIREKKITKIV